MSCSTLKDPERRDGDRHAATALTFVAADAFARLQPSRWRERPADYASLKAEARDRLLGEVLRRHPALEPMLEHVELSTPLSTEYFTGARGGSVYRLEPTHARFTSPFTRAVGAVPGLILGGTDVFVPGVLGAIASGLVAAFAAAPAPITGMLRRWDLEATPDSL